MKKLVCTACWMRCKEDTYDAVIGFIEAHLDHDEIEIWDLECVEYKVMVKDEADCEVMGRVISGEIMRTRSPDYEGNLPKEAE